MSIEIRLAEKSDAALVADISRQTFFETFASANTAENMEKFMNEQFTREALMEEVGTEGNIFFLAYDGETPVGYARMREPGFEDRKSIEIARIYAVQSSLGKGVGNALMQKCIDTAIGFNKETIWLGVWEKKFRAIQFYEK